MNKKAFTLIELLVVVLIIGILAAIALPRYQRAVRRATLSDITVNLKAISSAVEVYIMINNTYPEAMAQLDAEIGKDCNSLDCVHGKYTYRISVAPKGVVLAYLKGNSGSYVFYVVDSEGWQGLTKGTLGCNQRGTDTFCEETGGTSYKASSDGGDLYTY